MILKEPAKRCLFISVVWLAYVGLAAAATCGTQTYDPSQYDCVIYQGNQLALCPKSAPCACPTPAAQSVGGAPYGLLHSLNFSTSPATPALA
ncbi:hypothetical protein WJX84_005444 [Apatococcus fuscideae]|uniref:Secreted protein n=1 Tax=Apatococcus fuscideae TaxID=2026836 RepID=A0AAW1SUN6_9CHLO